MSRTRLGLDVGHCDTMLCMRLPDGTVRCLKLDCAGSTKINTAHQISFLTIDILFVMLSSLIVNVRRMRYIALE